MKQENIKAAIGKKGERIAARLLKKKGYRILARNRHFGRHELDIVAANRDFIVFVEVKARSVASSEMTDTRPALAVDAAKRRRTLEAAHAYLREHPTSRTPRMDVIEVYFDREKHKKPLRSVHIEDAFGSDGRVH